MSSQNNVLCPTCLRNGHTVVLLERMGNVVKIDYRGREYTIVGGTMVVSHKDYGCKVSLTIDLNNEVGLTLLTGQ